MNKKVKITNIDRARKNFGFDRYTVMRLIKGLSYNNSDIYVADTFVLDVLGIGK